MRASRLYSGPKQALNPRSRQVPEEVAVVEADRVVGVHDHVHGLDDGFGAALRGEGQAAVDEGAWESPPWSRSLRHFRRIGHLM